MFDALDFDSLDFDAPGGVGVGFEADAAATGLDSLGVVAVFDSTAVGAAAVVAGIAFDGFGASSGFDPTPDGAGTGFVISSARARGDA